MSQEIKNQLQPIIDSVPGMPQPEWGPTTLHGRGLENLGMPGITQLGEVSLTGAGIDTGPTFEEPSQPFNRAPNEDVNKRVKITVVRDAQGPQAK